jgi:hypothetical protein
MIVIADNVSGIAVDDASLLAAERIPNAVAATIFPGCAFYLKA